MGLLEIIVHTYGRKKGNHPVRRLAVEQKNRSHKLHPVAHHLNLHAKMLQIDRVYIETYLPVHQNFNHGCVVQVKSQRDRTDILSNLRLGRGQKHFTE